MKNPTLIVLISFVLVSFGISLPVTALAGVPGSEKLKVYVMIGMHVDFYHSWRGDTPDDAGFGLDIKVVRSSLQTLNAANKAGKKAKAYWDFSASHWTLGEFIPEHAPDLINLWKSRASMDEFVVGPYNNGANSAATKEEFQKSIAWTLNNPGGYGLNQLFPKVTMMYRPQENMLASHQLSWSREMGIHGLILHYSTWPFTAFSNFIAPLADSDRYNPLWLKTAPEEQPMVVLPAMFPIDLINETSLEALLVKLRKKQLSGEIKRNLVIHVNMDADAVSWMPMLKSSFLQKLVPNTGGLQEIIDTVNKFKWSDFTTPDEYLKIEQPQKEILVGQDMADGAFDGFYSWAERSFTQKYWTKIEESRRFEMATKALPSPVRSSFFQWGDEAFQNRLLALSTTHFGMSTPFVNQQRLQHLDKYTSRALELRENQFKSAAQMQIENPLLTEIHWADFPRFGESQISQQKQLASYPIKVRKGFRPVFTDPNIVCQFKESIDSNFDLFTAYTINSKVSSWKSSEILQTQSRPLTPTVGSEAELKNKWIRLRASSQGITDFEYNHLQFGDEHFLSPFITFDENKSFSEGQKSKGGHILSPKQFTVSTQAISESLSEIQLQTQIEFKTKDNNYKADLNYRLQLHSELPYLYLKVDAQLPNTLLEKLPEQATRKFLRHVDFRWREIALANMRPLLGKAKHYQVWKSNFTNKLSTFQINYEEFNAKNKEFDSLNNQQTPGWVAFSRGDRGILIATNTAVRSSMAFVPMRLHNQGGEQILSINPFGTYHGEQLNYRHLGGEKLGTLIANAGAPVVLPNAPTFNGEQIEMDLMIAPFEGSALSADLIEAAKRFAYPPVALYTVGGETLSELDYKKDIVELKRQQLIEQLELADAPLAAPVNFAAAPDNGGAIFTWKASDDPRAEKQEVVYRQSNSNQWQSVVLKNPNQEYLELKSLTNDQKYVFGLRSYNSQKFSEIQTWQSLKPTEKLEEPLTLRPTLDMIWKFVGVLLQHHSIKDPDP
jgi:hypothetical protein